MLPTDVDVVDGENCWLWLLKKMIVADGSMRCGHSLSSKMLDGKACVVGVELLCGGRWQGDVDL